MVGFRSLIRVSALAGTALLTCSACIFGGDDDEISRGNFEGELVHAVCDTVVDCCDQASLGFLASDCRQTVMTPFGNQLNLSTVSFNGDAASKCIQAYRQLSSACQKLQFAYCANVFTGNVPPGGPCQQGWDCDPGPNGFAVCGPDHICALPARGVQNQPCSYSCRVYDGRSDCKSIAASMSGTQTACFEENGLTCFIGQPGSTPTCQPFNLDCRQRIDKSLACPQGTYCDDNTGGCSPNVPIGGNCSVGKCVNEGFCFNNVCQPRVPVAARCDQEEQCQSGRCYGGFCKTFSPAAEVMCRGAIE